VKGGQNKKGKKHSSQSIENLTRNRPKEQRKSGGF